MKISIITITYNSEKTLEDTIQSVARQNYSDFEYIIVDGGSKDATLDIVKKYGLEVDPDAKIEDISVGMQQRVEILKALYRGADILILDEPTVGLDPKQVTEIRTLIKNLGKKHTVI